MKKGGCILFLFLFPIITIAQFLSVESNVERGTESHAVKKTVFDTAQIKLYYSLEFKKDSTRNDTTRAQLIMLISDKYTLCADYYDILEDSVTDDSDKRKESLAVYLAKCSAYFAKRKFKMTILSDLQKGTTTVRERAFIYTYEYEEPTPEIAWNILPEDTLINGMACGKATCRFRGRDYVAWYLKDVPLPYGPYRFNGLPGLVAMIKDTRGHYCFTLNGAQDRPTYTNLIYLDIRNYEFFRDTRDKIRTMIRQNYEHEADLMLQDPRVKLPADAAKKLDRTPDPYNPIELE